MKKRIIKRKRGMLAVIAAAMASLFLFTTAAYASDQAVVFTEDPADAEKGQVYIGAIVEKGFKGEVTVELYPEFEGGSLHQYVLSEENNYLVNDSIMTGSYEAVAYLSGKNRKNGETAEYGNIAMKVRPEGEGDIPYFAAVAGSNSFVEEYAWLSLYAAEKGTELCGPVTWEEAKGFFRDTVAQQNKPEQETQEPESDTAVWEPEVDITNSNQGKKTDIKGEKPSAVDEPQEPVDESQTNRAGKWMLPAAVAAVCILTGCGFFVWRRKSK